MEKLGVDGDRTGSNSDQNERSFHFHFHFHYYYQPSQCSPDYMNWFYMIYHPFMSPAQPGDPPRHPPVQHHDTFVELDVA